MDQAPQRREERRILTAKRNPSGERISKFGKKREGEVLKALAGKIVLKRFWTAE